MRMSNKIKYFEHEKSVVAFFDTETQKLKYIFRKKTKQTKLFFPVDLTIVIKKVDYKY